MASSPAPSVSSGPGSPSSLDVHELEAAVLASCSVPRLTLDPPALTLEPPTSPESGERRQRVPTSPPQAFSAASPRPAAKRQRGGSSTVKKGKSKEKDKTPSVSASAPPQNLLNPNLWASLLSASSSSSAPSSSSTLPSTSASTSSSAPPSSSAGPPALGSPLPAFPSASSPVAPGFVHSSAPSMSATSSAAAFSAPLGTMLPTPQHQPLSADQVFSLLQHPWLSSLAGSHPGPSAPGIGKSFVVVSPHLMSSSIHPGVFLILFTPFIAPYSRSSCSVCAPSGVYMRPSAAVCGPLGALYADLRASGCLYACFCCCLRVFHCLFACFCCCMRAFRCIYAWFFCGLRPSPFPWVSLSAWLAESVI
jgi:hypothetical protein